MMNLARVAIPNVRRVFCHCAKHFLTAGVVLFAENAFSQGQLAPSGSAAKEASTAREKEVSVSQAANDDSSSAIAPQSIAPFFVSIMEDKNAAKIRLKDGGENMRLGGGDGSCFLGSQSGASATFTTFQVMGSDYTYPMGVSSAPVYVVGYYSDATFRTKPFRASFDSITGEISDVRVLPLTGFDEGAAFGVSNEGAVIVGSACKNSDGVERCDPYENGDPSNPNENFAPKAVRWDGTSKISIVPRPTQFITSGETHHPLYHDVVPSSSENTIGEASEVSDLGEEIVGSYGWAWADSINYPGIPVQSFAFRWKKPTPTPTPRALSTIVREPIPPVPYEPLDSPKLLSPSASTPTSFGFGPSPTPALGLDMQQPCIYAEVGAGYDERMLSSVQGSGGQLPQGYYPVGACPTPTPIPTGASYAIPVPAEGEGGPPTALCTLSGACNMPEELGCCNYSNGYGLTADGETAVGTFALYATQGQNRRRAFKWRGGEARMQALPPLDSASFALTPTVTPRGVAHGISPDGVLIVGEDSKGQNQQLAPALQPAVPYPTFSVIGTATPSYVLNHSYRFHEAFGFTGTPGPTGGGASASLGDLPDLWPTNPSNPPPNWEDFKDSRARDASNSPYIVVGTSYNGFPFQTVNDDERPLRTAFIWEEGQSSPMKEWLLSSRDFDIDQFNGGGMKWHLIDATAITPDGSVIVGWGTCIPQNFASFPIYGFVLRLH